MPSIDRLRYLLTQLSNRRRKAESTLWNFLLPVAAPASVTMLQIIVSCCPRKAAWRSSAVSEDALSVSVSPIRNYNIDGGPGVGSRFLQLGTSPLTKRFTCRPFWGIPRASVENSGLRPDKHHHVLRSRWFQTYDIISDPDHSRGVLHSSP